MALVVAETELPDEHVFRAVNAWRNVVPTARRVLAAHVDRFRARAEELRPGRTSGRTGGGRLG